MTAERGEGIVLLDNPFCFLDYTYEELGSLFHSPEIRSVVEKSGFEGQLMICELESFLETIDPHGLYEPTDISDDEELREIFTYILPLEATESIKVYLQSLAVSERKQTRAMLKYPII